VSLVVPPLRERVEEIPRIAEEFVARFCTRRAAAGHSHLERRDARDEGVHVPATSVSSVT